MSYFERKQVKETVQRLSQEPRRFIQVIFGARQVGKTTLAEQVAESCSLPHLLVNCDDPQSSLQGWLSGQWEAARKMTAGGREALLIVDEIQRISDWSRIVKFEWDKDSRTGCALKVMLLGSAPLLLQRGLSESLAGRFEKIYLPHWSFPEMRQLFGCDLDQYICYGGYPGSAALIADERRWKDYLRAAIIDPLIGRDLAQVARIDKPALMHQLFTVGCACSGQIVSYTKLAGQLQERNHTVTLASYLQLLEQAAILCGLMKYSGSQLRRRRSSPKLQVFNNALLTVNLGRSLADVRQDAGLQGRLVESAVGAHLVNLARGEYAQVFYWRDGNCEVDYVVEIDGRLLAIEVASSPRHSQAGLLRFAGLYPQAERIMVGPGSLPVEDFLQTTSLGQL